MAFVSSKVDIPSTEVLWSGDEDGSEVLWQSVNFGNDHTACQQEYHDY